MSTRTVVLLLLVVLAAGLFLAGCTKDAYSIFNPNYTKGATGGAPVITSITPNSGLALITTMTIHGTGFAPSAANEILYCNSTVTQIISASDTQIVFKAPNIVQDSIRIRVAVANVAAMSNVGYVKLGSAVLDFATPPTNGSTWGVATDVTGNVYISFSGDSIYRFTPAKVKTGYYYNSLLVNQFRALKVGPGGFLYGTNSTRTIYKVTPPNGCAGYTSVGSSKAYDIDFDAAGNMWAVGLGTSVYRIPSGGGAATAFPISPTASTLRSVRVFATGGTTYLYAAGFFAQDNAEEVVRYPMDASSNIDSTSRQVVFNYSANLTLNNGRALYAITLSSTGDLFIGTDGTDAILIIPSGGTAQIFNAGIFSPTYHMFAWGSGSSLYAPFGAASATVPGAMSTSLKVCVINTLLTSAPYYGQSLP